jgi:hypothetical protein
MLIFAEGGKTENNPPINGENHQQTPLAYDAEFGIEPGATMVSRGER